MPTTCCKTRFSKRVNRKSFKLSSTDSTTAEGALIVNSIVRVADDGTKTLSERDVTVVPKYKPEWTLLGTTINKQDKSIEIQIKGSANVNYTSEVTSSLSQDDVSVWIDGTEISGIYKKVLAQSTTTSEYVLRTITLTDFEEAVRQAGKSYKEWSGNITLKIAGRGEATSTYTANILTDKYGNQSMSASDETGTWINIDLKDETASTSNEDGKMFTDFITPEFTYEYANTTIDHDTKKVTVVFDITDKYFDKSSLSEDTTASQITVDFEGTEATNATKELTKLSDITATINGVENTKIGEKYKLVVSNLDQGQGGDYSGIMKLAFKAGELNADGSLKSGMVDKSGNLSIDKTITIGVDEPNANITAAKPSDLFDKDGSNADGLHIGDFVNYDAGTWTQDEINSIQTGLKTNLQTANGSTDRPTNAFQFGGFTAGSSRNENATPGRTYNYVKDAATGGALTGWRIFDIDGDNITLISAGDPEDYVHLPRDNYGYISEYILTGNINSGWSESEIGRAHV